MRVKRMPADPAISGSSGAQRRSASVRERVLEIDGRPVRLRMAKNARAKRISMRIDRADGSVAITLPAPASFTQGLDFALREKNWLKARLAALPKRILFEDGALIPLFGVPHRLTSAPGARRGVWAENGQILVSGASEFMARRATDWLKQRAEEAFLQETAPMAEKISRRISHISVIDPKSRWGSCSSRGRLAFSWRLVLAPKNILAYVAAHEVAHLAEMNHSPSFWAVVAALAPDFPVARQWLKEHGAQLHRYG